ncbi:hypothetical protein R1flu_004810 [Riccia fluitans]|uniref:Peroxidase n=1 Tax=Riccia fluitans TaxID=41844 RepID=A0ABD1YRD0_9MARC
MECPLFERRWISVIGFVLAMCVIPSRAQLSMDFYSATCPQMLSLVEAKVDEFIAADSSKAGGFVRLQFHDCFVRGCDASVLLRSPVNAAEMDAAPNAGSLRGLDEIDEVKAVLEEACPGVVSCADIITLVARDAIVAIGGPTWPVPLGRRDGVVSSIFEATINLASPDEQFGQLVQRFNRVGLSLEDLVILSGAHTIGRSHCVRIMRRLYNFVGIPGATDPSIDPDFARSLKFLCPVNQGTNFVPLDNTSDTFDNTYFVDLQANRGVFTSDATLLTNPTAVAIINSAVLTPSLFLSNFSASMVKMGNIGVLTGSAGEVRLHCGRRN